MNAAPSPARASAEPAFAKATFEADGLLPHIALAALAAFQVALIVTHELWRDELQALMLAQHSTSLADLFANLHYEGHPALWYLILRALAPFGHGPEVLKAVQIAVTLSTIAIVWTRAPFGQWQRLLVLAGYLILFEWGTIARSYGLGVMLYFAFLALNRRPLAAYLMLGLVANTSAHFMLLAGVSALLLPVLDKRVSFSGLALFAALSLVAVATAWPASDAHTTIVLAPTLHGRFTDALEAFSGTLMPIDPSVIPPRWKGLPLAAAIWAGMLAPAIGAFAIMPRSPIAAALFLLLYAAVFAFSVLVYPSFPRHTGVIFLLLVGTEWLLLARGQGPMSVLSRTWIALLAACGLWFGAWALVIPFSAMRYVSRTIAERHLADVQWAVYPSFHGPEISARLNRPFYDIQKQCLAWYEKWDAASVKAIDRSTIVERAVAAAAASGGRLMLLTDQGISDPAMNLVAAFEPRLHIYEATAPADAESAPLPFCK